VRDGAPQLVLVGRRLWLYQEILAEIERHPWAKDVIVTGYVSEEVSACAIQIGASVRVSVAL
jgi:hypothetical protein